MVDGMLVDANLAVLLAVGSTNLNYIKAHKRLTAYDNKDFELLLRVVSSADAIVFTPNILSETSNLARYMKEPGRTEVAMVLQRIIACSEERYVSSKVASIRTEYVRLGLTDAALLEVLEPGMTLLTVDLDLYLAAERAKRRVLNFNHFEIGTVPILTSTMRVSWWPREHEHYGLQPRK